MAKRYGEILERYGLSAFVLKIIAICSMTLDHIGAIMFPEVEVFRLVGRIAFPIFCFFIAQGARHTSNFLAYETRLLIFALISEIPFDLAFENKWLYWEHQNVYFTLLAGLACIHIIEKTNNLLWQYGAMIILALLAEILRFDYGAMGVMVIVIFYKLIDSAIYAQLGFILINTISFGISIQLYANLASIPLMLYNGKRGPRIRWLFYGYYPIHLGILWFIKKKGGF